MAKTLLIRSLAAALSLHRTRVQFTADLMPGDVTGSLIYDAKTAQFQFRQGPVFTNLLLADEVNRTPAKTQAALLEAMEERHVSVEGGGARCRTLPGAATQNPVEYEGTYPLPEAQLDRFLFKLVVQVPARDEEISRSSRRHADGFDPGDLAAAGDQAGRRRRQTTSRPGRRCAGSGSHPRSPGTSWTWPGPPVSPLAAARRVPPRRDGAAVNQPCLGLAGRAGLRDTRRRQGAGPADPAAPGAAAAGGRAGGRHGRRRARGGARLGSGAAVKPGPLSAPPPALPAGPVTPDRPRRAGRPDRGPGDPRLP